MRFIQVGLVLVLACGLSACPRPPAGAPTADFTAAPKYGKKPLEVQFTDTSLPGDSAITAWAWDFGDDADDDKDTSTEQNPKHTFTANGVFNVELKVTNAQGSNTTLQTASVVVGNVWAETDGYGNGDDEGVSVAVASNGDIVVLSQVILEGRTDTQIQIERRNADGETIWANFYGGTDDETPGEVIVSTDGDIVFCATTESFGAGNSDAWVVRLDSVGQEVWSETYGTFSTDVANDIAQSGNDFVVAGKTGAVSEAYLFKVDQDGEELWAKSYGTSSRSETIHAVRAVDSGYILCGEQSGANSQVYVLRVDANGVEQWSSVLGGTGSDRAYEVFSSGTGYVLFGTGYSETFSAYDVMMMNVDKDGKLTSTAFVGGAGREEGYAVVQASGAFIVAGSTTTATNGGRDVYLASVASNGEKNWSRVFGGAGDEQANAIAVSGGDFILAGSTTSWGEGAADTYLLRVNSTGYGPQDPTAK